MKIATAFSICLTVLLLSLSTGARADIKTSLSAASAELAKIDLPKDELDTLYANRDYKPVWNFTTNENGSITNAFIDSLEQLISYHGLREQDYPVDQIKSMQSNKNDDEKYQLDILVTASLLRLAHDLHGDTVDLKDDYPGWNLSRTPIDMPAQLNTALSNGTVNDFIGGLAPKNPAYAKLASALHTYRAYASKGVWPRIDIGPSLRPNDINPRVAQLRARLEAEDYIQPVQPDRDHFDEALEKALVTYQLRNGLEPDGHGGTKTQEALNTSLETRIQQIRANMERWRHMPEDFPPDRYLAVNIADASIQIIDGGKELYRGPVVIGKVDRKTPFIHSAIHSMIVNPIWHVPTKIAQKDILPKLRKDPHYLEKLGFVISGNEDDPYGANIDWSKMKERTFNFRLRQAPGDQNSLGHLKFDFDNDFAVYMHGTPHQDLFAKAQRNFSSGCIRLRDPDEIGEFLLKDTAGGWNADKIETEVDSNKTRWVAIKNPMPIYVLYWSVFADEETGAINFRKDAYDYDHILEDAPVPAPPQNESRVP